MNDATRRGFLATAGIGAAAVGVAAVAPGASAAAAVKAKAAHKGVTVDGPVGAYVHDAAKGEVVVFAGEREVTVTDHDLVAHLTSKLG
jgi:3-hydroxyisobutyrate dehydrogenase-like beta-hydroxyacid dehydrogenase